MLQTLPSPTVSSHSSARSTVDSICGGCKKSVESDHGGVVVSFGNCLWHVDCFKCAKCGNQVTAADTNLLLLSDGSPVCSNCSYHCNICKKPISDEAIMTGDESYHAACFTCRSCRKPIEELVFAKTSQGIYCMTCHNERVARSRRHEAKRSKAKTSSRPKERPGDRSGGPSTPSIPPDSVPSSPLPTGTSISFNSPSPPVSTEGSTSSFPFSVKSSATSVAQVSPPAAQVSGKEPPPPPKPPKEFPLSLNSIPPSPTVVAATPHETSFMPRSPRERVDTLPLPTQTDPIEPRRRKSYDSGVRPVSSSLGSEDTIQSNGLQIPKTSRAAKRHSDLWRIDPQVQAIGSNPSGSTDGHSPVPLDFYSPAATTPLTLNGSTSGEGSASSSRGTSPLSKPLVDSRSAPHVGQASDTNGKDAVISAPPRSQSIPEPIERGRQLGPSRLNGSDDTSSRLGRSPQRSLDIPSSGGALSVPSVKRSPSFNGRSSPQSVLPVPPVKRSASVSGRSNRDSLPPLPPPKEKSASVPVPGQPLPPEGTGDQPDLFPAPDSPSTEDGLGAKHSPITPPSLPAIDFSSQDTDFADLLSSVGQSPSKRPPGSKPMSTELEDESHLKTPTAPPTSGGGDFGSIPIVIQDERRQPVDLDDFPRASLESRSNMYLGPNAVPVSPSPRTRPRGDSSASLPASTPAKPAMVRQDTGELVTRRLREALADAAERGATNIRLDREFVEAILLAIQGSHQKYSELKGRFDGMKRTSQQVMAGLTVAQEEYDKELALRRDAEAEVTRLRVQLSGQAARLTAMSAEDRRRDMMEQMSKDLSASLHGLETDLSKLKVERDMAIAEVEELANTKKLPQPPSEAATGSITRSLTSRFDGIKSQYRRELEPLTFQREALIREIQELKEARDIFLEETTALNARNEELAELNAQVARQIESSTNQRRSTERKGKYPNISPIPSQTSIPQSNSSSASVATSNTLLEEPDGRYVKIVKAEPEPLALAKKGFGWFKQREPSAPREPPSASFAKSPSVASTPSNEKPRGVQEHNFQQQSVLRFARCDHCGDKMWGTQLRCSNCGIACHTRCINHIQTSCSVMRPSEEIVDIAPPPPSMFARDLVEQVRADAKGGDRMIPVIVEKCIDAVEALGMDYEGIYRKTGGSSQNKAITQLFERGNYEAIDLKNSDSFNDISSVTSVLKNYFRALPNPLLTFALHESFVEAAHIKDPMAKNHTLAALVLQLPPEHFYTLRYLMTHLYRINARNQENLMNARNLGVVFGPTLMRSPDSTKEFADMAGKALSIEWLIENAPTIFSQEPPEP